MLQPCGVVYAQKTKPNKYKLAAHVIIKNLLTRGICNSRNFPNRYSLMKLISHRQAQGTSDQITDFPPFPRYPVVSVLSVFHHSWIMCGPCFELVQIPCYNLPPPLGLDDKFLDHHPERRSGVKTPSRVFSGRIIWCIMEFHSVYRGTGEFTFEVRHFPYAA